MKRHLMYLVYVLRHKYFVFLECLRLGVPLWIAFWHDYDKFLPDEWIPYARCFYKPDGTKQYVPDTSFAQAWNAHQKRNRHHWQFWIIVWDRGESECLPMPDIYIREMIADWRGAGLALGKPDTLAWYQTNKDNIKLHPETRKTVEMLIELGKTKRQPERGD